MFNERSSSKSLHFENSIVRSLDRTDLEAKLAKFVSLIAVGELVAVSDCRQFIEFFRGKNDPACELYRQIHEDERQH